MSMIKPGMVIGDRYEIIEKIGSGGMADVYKARCQRLNRFVAIKILKPEYSGDESFVTKFRGEAQSCAGLTHPNIVGVFDVGDSGRLHYIVMELVEGITLKRFIERKGRLTVKDAVGIAIQIAQGLDAAHQNHVIHRDIKPQNIIISREGKVKVADFGIAKAASTNTINQNAIGSVHYLSPEQARGGYSDERSDIYSLGITIYEMLAGRVPFAGDNSVSVALLHIQGEATPLHELNPDVTPSLEKIVQKCMQKKPERRYMTATELIKDLKASITNPNGDFVRVAPMLVTDSPTREMTEAELGQIKSAPKAPSYYEEDDEVETTHRISKSDELDEDEELDGVSSAAEKVYLVGSILVVIALIGLLLYLVLKFVGVFDKEKNNNYVKPTNTPGITMTSTPTPGKSETMPNYYGYKLMDVVNELKAMDLDLDITYEPSESSDNAQRDSVIEQTPGPGSTLVQGTKVHLVYSIGPDDIVLDPTLFGKTKAEAKNLLEDAGLTVKFEYLTSGEVAVGSVVKTNPALGTAVEAGSTVTVYICSGRDIPNVVGKTLTEATMMLNDAGLQYTTDDEFSATVPVGQIIRQTPAAGVTDQDVTVELIISLGPEPTPTPTPTPEDSPTPTPTPTPTPIPEDPPETETNQ